MSQNNVCLTEPITLVELILDSCGNEFGLGSCTATGTPCYNTWHTCKDKCNYTCSTRSQWFSTCDMKVPPHLGVLTYSPSITSTTHEPTKLDLGKTFSTRGKITICFQDHPHNDEGMDPYILDRHVIPIRCAEQLNGTLWGRLIARQKYFKGRRVNVYTGYCEQNLCEFDKQTYYIDKLTGPDQNCKVCLSLKDPLILAESAKCPSSESKLVAQQAIGAEFPLPFTLGGPLDGLPTEDDADLNPYALIGTNLLQNNYFEGDESQDKCFERLKHICIGNEVMKVRAVRDDTVPAGWNIKLIERGVCGSEITEHKGGANIQLAESFSGHINDVVCQLLDCMGLDTLSPACCEDDDLCIIDWDSFREFRCKNPLAYVDEVIICKGETVKKLLDELSAQFLFFLYYDASTGKVSIRSICPPECDQELIEIDLCQIFPGSFKVKESDEFYNVIEYEHDVVDCSSGLDSDNLSTKTVIATADILRDECDRREYKSRSIKTFKSRWINSSNTFLAKANGDRWLQLRNCAGMQVTLQVTNEFGKCLEFGGYTRVCHPKLQDTEGNYLRDYWLIKAKAPSEKCTTITLEKMPFDETTALCMNCDTACPATVDIEEECNDDCARLW